MSKIDVEYHNLLDKILQEGYTYEDPNRKGISRIEIPSYTFRHEFEDGFPAISTKKLHYKNVVTELLWFLRGDTNIKYLVDNGCNIWNKDAYNYYCKKFKKVHAGFSQNLFTIEEFVKHIKEGVNLDNIQGIGITIGDLGPVYGHQWRRKVTVRKNPNVNGARLTSLVIDQISNLIKGLKEKPLGTEHIVNSWDPVAIPKMALPPCHYGFQVVVRPLDIPKYHDIYNIPYPKYGFELHWNQRSVDTFLGLPYNITSYATLALILEKITGYKALGIQGDLKKVHLYDNSLDAVKEQLSRDVDKYKFCQLEQSYFTELMDEFDDKDFNLDDFMKMLDEDKEFIQLVNYKSYPAINVEMLERNK